MMSHSHQSIKYQNIKDLPISLIMDNTIALNCITSCLEKVGPVIATIRQRLRDIVESKEPFIPNTIKEDCPTNDVDPIAGLLSFPTMKTEYLKSDLQIVLSDYVKKMKKIHSDLSHVQAKVINNFLEWKSTQNAPASPSLPESTQVLNEIQEWFRCLWQISYNCRSQLTLLLNDFHASYNENCDDLSSLLLQFKELFKSMLENSLAIKRGPGPIKMLVKDTTFQAEVCFLPGPNSQLQLSPAVASVLNETEINDLLTFYKGSKRVEYQPSPEEKRDEQPFSSAQQQPSDKPKAKRSRKSSGDTTTPKSSRKRSIKAILGLGHKENKDLDPKNVLPPQEPLPPLHMTSIKLAKFDTFESVDNNNTPQLKMVTPECAMSHNIVSFHNKGNCSAKFSRARVAHVGRQRGKDSVLETEYWLLFHTEVSETICGEEQKWWIWTYFDHYYRVLSNTTQKSKAWALTIWSNAANIANQSSNAPLLRNFLHWDFIAQELNNNFLEQTELGLNENQLHYLKTKVFSVPRKAIYEHSVEPDYLEFEQFFETNISSDHANKFTFSDWLFHSQKLILTYLCGKNDEKTTRVQKGKQTSYAKCEMKPKDANNKVSGPWQDRKVIGFIGRADAEAILIENGLPGCMLLRFPDSVLGSISITWLYSDKKETVVIYQDPLTENDLNTKSLASSILTFEPATHLYPDIPKSVAFGSYAQDQVQTRRGYASGITRTFSSFMAKKFSVGKQDASSPSSVAKRNVERVSMDEGLDPQSPVQSPSTFSPCSSSSLNMDAPQLICPSTPQDEILYVANDVANNNYYIENSNFQQEPFNTVHMDGAAPGLNDIDLDSMMKENLYIRNGTNHYNYNASSTEVQQQQPYQSSNLNSSPLEPMDDSEMIHFINRLVSL